MQPNKLHRDKSRSIPSDKFDHSSDSSSQQVAGYSRSLNNKPSKIEVISSGKLSEVQKNKIKNKALGVFGLDSADFSFFEDKSLIGGFLLKYGSKVCDLSVKGTIEAL